MRRVGDSAGWGAANALAIGNTSTRPLLLNRPFRSVGELGFVFRDDPWKNLNLISARNTSTGNSADSALLDIFYVGANPAGITPPPAVVAGKVDINSASAPVLTAIIANAVRNYQPNSNPAGSTISGADMTSVADSKGIAADIVAKLKAASPTPFMNLADLPGIFPQDTTTKNTKYPGSKPQREAAIRALADSCGTRTWNLMIDIIAQSGKYPVATSGDLNKFVVEGEKHYWLHVAIDRFTGEIVDQQLELVRE